MKKNYFKWTVNAIPVLFAAGSAPAADRPNVLVIMADDMRYDQMTHAGHPYVQTPNLDRLAAEGVRFTHAYASTPLCGPCRMSIFSGQLPPVHGRVDNFYYPEDYDVYLPESFKQQGYRTAMIGKWYEGSTFKKKTRGSVYDFWFEMGEPDLSKFTGQPRTPEYAKFRDEHMYYDQEYDVNGKTTVIKGHMTDILFDAAGGFAAEKSQKPFMTFMTTFAPHGPFNPTLERKGKYTGKGIPPRENNLFGKNYMTPARTKQMTEVHERTCEMIEDIDDGIGRIFETLEKSGELDNTIIVFTSDNGVMFGEHAFGWKRHPWQESVRVPLIIRYPKAIAKGTVSDAAVTLVDLFPTLAELAGVKLPNDPFRYGKSLVPLMNGTAKSIRDATLFLQYEKGIQGKYDFAPEEMEWVALTRDDGWKLVRYRVGPPADMRAPADFPKTMLFNLNDDPYEMNNLAGAPEHQSLIEKMKEQISVEMKKNKGQVNWL